MGDRLLQFLSLISLLFLLEWTQISSFNLDTENVMIKKGDSGSLFGYSLAMHQQLHPDKRKLLVGAPKAKALNGQKSKITGGLYDCDSPLISTSCNRLQFDNSEDLESESKENQWMGVTVNSQGPGGKIVTCAHRYQQRKRVNSDDESRNILGRCYVLSQDLTIKQEPGDGGDWKLCEGRKAGHELYGSCQQGMSATFTQDPYYLVFGVPGAFNWKGVVRVENSSLLQLGIFDDGPYELGEDNPAKIPVPDSSYLGRYLVLLSVPPLCSTVHFVTKKGTVQRIRSIDVNFQLSFSLDSGNAITKKDQLTIVAGAPRANHSGAVVLLKTVLSTNLLEKEYILEGEGLASSFGYDLTVVDLNADGWQDIVVGAPQYFEKDKKVGGAIYVYINKNGDWNMVKPTRIDGTEDSMFGLAVENLGDLNMDNYNDIAVGAPYTKEGGKVFIYHGSADGLITTPTQVLSGSAGTKLFGYSLAGNMDLDMNSYPDLAVGSLSDSVTRSVINIETNIMCCVGIPVQVNVEIENPKRTRRQIPGISPILNPKPQKPVMVNFRKEGCGSDNVCQSKLKLQHRFCYKEPNTDEFSPLKVVQKDIALEITVTNENGDDAHEATLVASLPSTLTYSADYSAERQVICKANTNGSQAVCDLGNPFKRNSWVKFYIILSTAGIPLDTTDLEIDLQLGTTSVQDPVEVKAKAKVEIELQLSLTGLAKPSQVYFSGEAKGESAMKTEGDVGSLIEFEFRMINLGRALKTYGTSYLIINWPKETMEGKWILYLMKMNAQGLGQITCSPESEINPHTLKESSNSRKRRATKETKPSEGTISALLNKERKSATLSCGDGAKCVEIRCPLHDLDSNAVILLRSRLWNTTFLEEYSELNYLEVIVTASLKVDGIAENMILKNTETQMKVTVFPERLMAQYGGTPWWPILLAILLGLLMLGLLAFLLWKWGFFKRSKYDDSVPSYNAVRIKNEENDHLESLEKKAWITSWNKNESHS
uniref:Integrin alpha-2 domain-containing protein n=1 Tax=Esox lucius TaxID=8010 RepID=A0AAY5KPQ6_ESOLU